MLQFVEKNLFITWCSSILTRFHRKSRRFHLCVSIINKYLFKLLSHLNVQESSDLSYSKARQLWCKVGTGARANTVLSSLWFCSRSQSTYYDVLEYDEFPSRIIILLLLTFGFSLFIFYIGRTLKTRLFVDIAL